MARIGHRYGWWPSQKTKLSDLMTFLFDGENQNNNMMNQHNNIKTSMKSSRVCIGCSEYLVHSKPVPSHFQLIDMAYCCTLCRINGGYHGGKCERRRPSSNEREISDDDEDDDDSLSYVPIKITHFKTIKGKGGTSYHNAGYDAHCTGKIFIRLVEQWNGKLMPNAINLHLNQPKFKFQPYRIDEMKTTDDETINNECLMSPCDEDDIYEVNFQSIEQLKESFIISSNLCVIESTSEQNGLSENTSSLNMPRIGDTIVYVNGKTCNNDIRFNELIDEINDLKLENMIVIGFLKSEVKHILYGDKSCYLNRVNHPSHDSSPIAIQSLNLPKNQINLLESIYSIKLNNLYDPQIMQLYTPNRNQDDMIYTNIREGEESNHNRQRLRIDMAAGSRLIKHTIATNASLVDISVPFGGKKMKLDEKNSSEDIETNEEDGSSNKESKRRKI